MLGVRRGSVALGVSPDGCGNCCPHQYRTVQPAASRTGYGFVATVMLAWACDRDKRNALYVSSDTFSITCVSNFRSCCIERRCGIEILAVVFGGLANSVCRLQRWRQCDLAVDTCSAAITFDTEVNYFDASFIRILQSVPLFVWVESCIT